MDACPGVSGAHGRAAPAHSSPPGNAALESEEKLSLGSGMVGCNKETTLNDAHPAAGTATAALSAAGSFTQAGPEKQLPPEVIAPPHTAPEGDLPYLYPGVGGAGGAPTTVGPMVVSTARSGRWTAKARVTSADASAAAPNGARDGSSSAAGRQVLGDLPHELALAGLAVLAAATSHGAGAGPPTNTGHWNIDERRLYEEALTTVGARQWEAIAKHVGTRDPTQARTHAQKLLQRAAYGQAGATVATTTAKAGSGRRARVCRRCKLHGKSVEYAGHRECQFAKCTCTLCAKLSLELSARTSIRRSRNRSLKRDRQIWGETWKESATAQAEAGANPPVE